MMLSLITDRGSLGVGGQMYIEMMQDHDIQLNGTPVAPDFSVRFPPYAIENTSSCKFAAESDRLSAHPSSIRSSTASKTGIRPFASAPRSSSHRIPSSRPTSLRFRRRTRAPLIHRVRPTLPCLDRKSATSRTWTLGSGMSRRKARDRVSRLGSRGSQSHRTC